MQKDKQARKLLKVRGFKKELLRLRVNKYTVIHMKSKRRRELLGNII
jgi:hypothetical protein